MSSDNKSIGQMHEITEHDPWDRRTDAQRLLDKLKRLLVEQDGNRPSEKPRFIDPADDEDLRIKRDASRERYHRITVGGHKLSEILLVESSLFDTALTSRNHAHGCWFALTSQRVAKRVTDTLRSQGFAVTLDLVNGDGQQTSYSLSEEDQLAIEGALKNRKVT